MKKQTTHGGRREGAGKKPGIMGKKVGTSVAFSPDVIEWMRAVSRSEEEPDKPTISVVLESIIRRSKEFKAWLKAKEE